MLKRFIKQSVVLPLAIAAYNGRPFFGFLRYFAVLREFYTYRRLVKQQGANELLALRNFNPWLIDKYKCAGYVDPYFYQDTWCARKLAVSRPKLHVDVGSSLMTAGIISQFTELVFVDIRPLTVSLPGLSFRAGTLTSLPFDSNSVESISSLSVVEHVGLGRYGDPLDALGTDRACRELGRVLRPGGALYVAVPTEKQASTHFNAHRIFTPDNFIAKFSGLYLAEERYAATNYGLLDRNQYEEAGMPYAYGCFHFGKNL
jgi:SAM-dependent methyltransferase